MGYSPWAHKESDATEQLHLFYIGVQNPPAKQSETQGQPVGREDPLEKETATHCSILAWEFPWTEEPGRLQS